MEPWQSWLLAIGLGGAAAVYYTQGGTKHKSSTARRSSTIPDQPEASAATKRKQTKLRSSNPGKSILVDDVASKARKEKAEIGGSLHRRGPSVSFDAEVDEPAQDDKEWARQLEATRKGISISSAAQGASKTKKQSKKSKQVTDQPAMETLAANDVSDMLESAPAAPSVIRLTGEEKAKKNQKSAGPVAQQETKKQRQNRRKAEEKRLQRETDESERQILLEKQRRTARESRGEPARNGSGVPQASSAWPTSPTVNDAALSSTSPAAPLLDTFDPIPTFKTSVADKLTTSSAAAPSSVNQNLPSEESQMEMLNELNGWAEVPTKGKKGKKSKDSANEEMLGATTTSVVPNVQSLGKFDNKFADVSTKELIGGKKKKGNANGFALLEAATDISSSVKGHPQDSDWAAN